MSKSEDNTNELESYGVWVKNATSSENNAEEKIENLDTETDDVSLDLPDFDDEEFSDMFKDESQFSTEENSDDFGNDLDTTLSTDELANITDLGDVAIENEDINPEEISDENIEPIFDEKNDIIEEPDFIPETIEDISDTVDLDSENSEEEISLDDFMDEGFSDDSIASGNNGYEAGKEPVFENSENKEETEEISLDDFLDEGSIENIIPEDKKDQEEDEEPIDMDISFDDSIDNVETEENMSLDNDYVEDTDENDNQDDIETEDVSLEDFTTDQTISEDSFTENSNLDNTSASFDTEEVDLSDFGIDADAEETPIVQDVEEEKNKEKIVDYDLFIGNENTSTAPVINELKEETTEDMEKDDTKEQNCSTTVDNSLLQQIVSDLSSLKEEINNLKTNIEEIKAKEAAKQPEKPEEITETEVLPVENDFDLDLENNDKSEDIDLPTIADEGGFFNSDDTDETIALSGDELNNIMNNADFTENTEAETENNIAVSDSLSEVTEDEPSVVSEEVFDNSESETSVEEPMVEESGVEEPIMEDEIKSTDDFNFDYENEKLEEPNIEDITIDETTEDTDEESLPDEISIPKDEDIFVESTSSDFMDSVKDSTEDNIAETDTLEEIENIEPVDEIEDISEENSEELENITDISVDDNQLESIDDSSEDEDIDNLSMDDENSDNKSDNLFVEDNETESNITEDEDLPTIDDLLNNPPEEEAETESVPTVEQIMEEKQEIQSDDLESDLTFDDVDFLNDKQVDESFDNSSELESNSNFDNDISESSNEPEYTDVITPEETEEEETSIDDSELPQKNYEEVDNLDNELSDSNIDYLTKKDDNNESKDSVNGELKQEIKSVLLYMDQLLENLPEEKIYEFAKSDEFATYKKLFKDLGLS